MWFESKKALLQYLGKNEKDNKLVDRLILRGEVCMVDGMYEIVDKDIRIRELEEEIRNLRNQQGKNTLTKVSEWDNSEGKNTLLEKIAWLESDLEYVNWEYEKMEEKLNKFQDALRNCYLWVRNVKKDKITRPDFKKDVLKLDEDVKWEDNQ